MRKLRKAAVAVAVAAGVGMIGVGAAAAQGESGLAITCEQDTGDNTVNNTEGGAVDAADALNGGDALKTADQQLCGLENEDAENAGDEETPAPNGTTTAPPGGGGGGGGVISGVTVGPTE